MSKMPPMEIATIGAAVLSTSFFGFAAAALQAERENHPSLPETCFLNNTFSSHLNFATMADAVEEVNRHHLSTNGLGGALMVAHRELPPFVPRWLWGPRKHQDIESLLPLLSFFGWEPKEELDNSTSLVVHCAAARPFHAEFDPGDGYSFSKGLCEPGVWRPLELGKTDRLFGRAEPISPSERPKLYRALDLVGQGRVWEARCLLQQLPDSSERIAARCLAKGERFLKQGRLEQAEVTFWLALEHEPAMTDAYIALANIYVDAQAPTTSLFYADRALQTEPDNPEALALMGRSYHLVAATALQGECQDLLDSCDAYIEQGGSRQETGLRACEQAEQLLRRAGPTYREYLSEAQASRANALQTSDVPRAWKLLVEACQVKCTPDRRQLLIHLTGKYATGLTGSGRIDEAIEVCEQVEEIVPIDSEDRASLLSAQMLCHSLQQDNVKAVAYARKLWELHRTDHDLRNYMICAKKAATDLCETDHFKEAAAQINELLTIAPDDGDLQRRLIDVHEAWGLDLSEKGGEAHLHFAAADRIRRDRRIHADPFDPKADPFEYFTQFRDQTNCLSTALRMGGEVTFPPWYWPVGGDEDLSSFLDLYGWKPASATQSAPLLVTRSRGGTGHVDICPEGLRGNMLTKQPGVDPIWADCDTTSDNARVYQRRDAGPLPTLSDVERFIAKGKFYECRVAFAGKGWEPAERFMELAYQLIDDQPKKAEICALIAIMCDQENQDARELLVGIKLKRGTWPEPLALAEELRDLGGGDRLLKKVHRTLGSIFLSPVHRHRSRDDLLRAVGPYLGEFDDPTMAGVFAYEEGGATTAPVPDPEYAWPMSLHAWERGRTQFRNNWMRDSAVAYVSLLLQRNQRPEANRVIREARHHLPEDPQLMELERAMAAMGVGAHH